MGGGGKKAFSDQPHGIKGANWLARVYPPLYFVNKEPGGQMHITVITIIIIIIVIIIIKKEPPRQPPVIRNREAAL